MENELYITVYHKESIDASKLNIEDENSPFFWSHHGYTPNDKERLENYCKIAHYLSERIKHGIIILSDLSENELEAYNVFFKIPPTITYSPFSNNLVVTDGRHRLAICKELDIKLDFDVKYDMKFMIYRMNKPVKNDGFIKKTRDFLFRGKGLGEEYFKEEEKYRYIAIPNREAEKKVLQDTGCDIEVSGEANDMSFLIVPYEKATLDRMIDHYKQKNIKSDVYLSKDRLNYLEEIR